MTTAPPSTHQNVPANATTSKGTAAWSEGRVRAAAQTATAQANAAHSHRRPPLRAFATSTTAHSVPAISSASNGLSLPGCELTIAAVVTMATALAACNGKSPNSHVACA